MSKTVLVTGSASGLGSAIVNELRSFGDYFSIIEYDVKNSLGEDVEFPEESALLEACGSLDILINCAAVNRIGWLEDFTDYEWDMVMDTNAKGIFKMSQACLPMLIKSKGTILNIVSNAAHMPMTCSLAYNASKAAAHIMTLQLARELTKKYDITVFGVAPNKLSGTEMSKSIDQQVCQTRGWTMEYAKEYQLNGLLTGHETPVERVAEFIGFLLSDKKRHEYLSGCILPYGA